MKNLSLRNLAIAAGAALFLLLPNSALAARTDNLWDYPLGGNYYKTNGSPAGVDILIYGTSHYLNFGSLSGSSGYGIRDNAGTIEFKNQGGSWAPFGSGGGTGTVTSVDLTTPTGLSVSGTPITNSGTIALSLTSGYVIPLVASTTDWNTAYLNRITSLTTSGSSGAATLSGNTLNIPQYAGTTYTAGTGLTLTTGAFSVNTSQNIAKLSNLTSNGFVKTSAGDGTLSIDTNTYLTGNQTVTLSGDVTGSGATAITTTYANVVPANKGGAGAVSGILKANGSGTVSGASNGTDFSLITALTCGASNHFSGVTAAGVFTCTADTGGSGVSPIATSTSETAGQLAYWTSNSATPATLGKVATSSPTNGTGITLSGTGTVVGGSLSITNSSPLSGLSVAFPFSFSNPTLSWIGLATTSQPASSNILVSNGTNGIYGVATSTLSASSPLTGSFTQIGSGGSLGCQTASGSIAGCLSSGDWTTFNSKQGAITLTTSGSSGAATLVGNTLNIPQYAGTTYTATWPITLTGSAFGFGGLSTTTPWTNLQLAQVASNGTVSSIATSSLRLTTSSFNSAAISQWTNDSGYLTANQSITLSGDVSGSGSTAITVNVAKINGVSLAGLATGILKNTTTTGVPSIAANGTDYTLITAANCTNQVITAITAAGVSTCSTVSNAMLANSTISGVALGGTLFAHTHDSTLSGTSYTGTAAVSDWGLNLGNANTWSALQQFGNASSTQLSVLNRLSFGQYATSSTDVNGSLSLAGVLTVSTTTATSTFSGGFQSATAKFTGLVEFVGNILADAGAILDFSNATVKQHLYPAFSYATSSAWTGTTTIPLGPSYTQETFNGIKCKTDVGTLNVQFGSWTASTTMLNASTTIGNVTYSANNSFSAGTMRYVDIGTPASAPTKISCTFDKTSNQ